jgi:hypothetical protein
MRWHCYTCPLVHSVSLLYLSANLIVQDRKRTAVITETHMNAAETRAVIGYLKRVHGLSAFGTAGQYSGKKGARASGGVLVIWDPSVLLCEGTEVIMPSRLVRVSLRVKADGTPLHLIGAYMPVRQVGQDDEVDEAWAALDAEAMRARAEARLPLLAESAGAAASMRRACGGRCADGCRYVDDIDGEGEDGSG